MVLYSYFHEDFFYIKNMMHSSPPGHSYKTNKIVSGSKGCHSKNKIMLQHQKERGKGYAKLHKLDIRQKASVEY